MALDYNFLSPMVFFSSMMTQTNLKKKQVYQNIFKKNVCISILHMCEFRTKKLLSNSNRCWYFITSARQKKMIWFKENTSISYIRLLFCNKTFWILVKCWELFVRNASSINRTTGKRDIAVGCVIVFILQFKKKTFHFCFNLFNLRWDCRIDFIRFEYIWISCNNRSNRRSS